MSPLKPLNSKTVDLEPEFRLYLICQG